MTKKKANPPIPEEYTNRHSYRHFRDGDRDNAVYGCGFMGKIGPHYDCIDILTDRYSLDYVLLGSGRYCDWNGVEHELYPGCAFQRLPDRLHSTYISRDEPYSSCCFSLHADLSRSLAEVGYIDAERPVLNPAISLELIKKYAKLCDDFCLLPEIDSRLILNQALEILADVYALDASNTADSDAESLMYRATMLLSENLAERIDLHAVAEKLGMQYDWFRKMFREHRKISPGKYRIHRRLETAISMLVAERKNIKSVAMALGYPDVSTFARQFKQVYGVPPGAFRKNALMR